MTVRDGRQETDKQRHRWRKTARETERQTETQKGEMEGESKSQRQRDRETEPETPTWGAVGGRERNTGRRRGDESLLKQTHSPPHGFI